MVTSRCFVWQPLLLDVLEERDLALAGVVPGTREHLLLLPVGGPQGFAAGGVGARRALLAVGVAVEPDEPGAPNAVPLGDPCHNDLFPSKLLAGLIPQARLKIYPEAAHGFLFQQHVEFARDVAAFLTE